MGKELKLMTPLHTATKRDCLGRMNDNKVEAMLVSKKYGFDYWDGERRYGYGGYKYIPGRLKQVAEELINKYSLKSGSKILDIGCGKAFLLYEIQLINPEISLFGIDISEHGLSNVHPKLKASLLKHSASKQLPFKDKEFDLAFSLGTFHNLKLPELEVAIPELQRVSRNQFLMVESYRDEQEMFNLECWALTAESIMHVDSWKWLFKKLDFNGDYEFIYF